MKNKLLVSWTSIILTVRPWGLGKLGTAPCLHYPWVEMAPLH